MKNVLVLRLSALGDLCQCLPVYHSLIKKYPKIHIHWLVDKNCLCLFDYLPNITLYPIDKSSLLGKIDSALLARKKLKQINFDAFINLHRSASANIINFFLPKLKDKNKYFKYDPIKAHAVYQYLTAIDKLKIQANLCFDLLRPVAKKTKKYIVICLSNSKHHPQKNLPIAIYQKIIAQLIEKQKIADFDIYLTGLKQDWQNSQEIINFIHNHQGKIKNLVAKQNLSDWLKLLENAELIISADSSAAHLADLWKIKCLSIYWTTNPDKSAPFLDRSNCLNFYPQTRAKYLNPSQPWDKRIRNDKASQVLDEQIILEKLNQLLKQIF